MRVAKVMKRMVGCFMRCAKVGRCGEVTARCEMCRRGEIGMGVRAVMY